MGRPNKIDEFVKEKIEYGFSRGLNKSEVCLNAGISRPTLDSYLKTHKRFSEHCELLKENTKMHAKLNIAEEIIENKNIELSKYCLEKASEKSEESSSGIIFREDIPLTDEEKRFGEVV